MDSKPETSKTAAKAAAKPASLPVRMAKLHAKIVVAAVFGVIVYFALAAFDLRAETRFLVGWDAGVARLVDRAPDARDSWFAGLLVQRSFGERLVTKVKNITSAAVRANCPQAAREKAKRIASAMTPNAIALRDAFAKRSETTLCSTNNAGRIRNAPSTFGSLKVPRARSYSVSKSCPPGTRLK